MDASTLKKTVLECLKDGELRGEFQSLIQEMVTGAVAEAMAARDTEIAELKDQLKRTTDQLNDLEQYSRRLCVNITGVPETTGESTDQIVTDLAKMAGVAVTPSDIDRSHRIGKLSDGKSRPIIVRFTNFTKRQEFYNARRELRKPRPVRGSKVSAETAGKTFVSDNLTKLNQHTMYVARNMKKEGKIHSAWTDVGKMKVRVKEGGQTKIIRSLEDLYAVADPARQPGAALAESSSGARESSRGASGRGRSVRGGRAAQ
ncbi:hypothetical protein FJT64_025677 [Amphibalanus amphitrite]|uniref:Uncharacterized protein n=1 Tax=Amphibalanus amphitrite TaxID=1232801 RepID=A0A6A4W862_AMPAM|nr:hypothetical protein FJT64_025677 [Amphibalanus amphitrite]